MFALLPDTARSQLICRRAACLGSLKRILKPGGLLVFHEEFPDPDRLSVAELRDLAEPAGFTLVDVTGNRWRDTVRFRS